MRIPKGRAPFVVRLFAAMLVMAVMAGHELRQEAVTVRVPPSRVPASVCMANGKVEYVTVHPTDPGVYLAHCQSGISLVTPSVDGK